MSTERVFLQSLLTQTELNAVACVAAMMTDCLSERTLLGDRLDIMHLVETMAASDCDEDVMVNAQHLARCPQAALMSLYWMMKLPVGILSANDRATLSAAELEFRVLAEQHPRRIWPLSLYFGDLSLNDSGKLELIRHPDPEQRKIYLQMEIAALKCLDFNLSLDLRDWQQFIEKLMAALHKCDIIEPTLKKHALSGLVKTSILVGNDIATLDSYDRLQGPTVAIEEDLRAAYFISEANRAQEVACKARQGGYLKNLFKRKARSSAPIMTPIARAAREFSPYLPCNPPPSPYGSTSSAASISTSASLSPAIPLTPRSSLSVSSASSGPRTPEPVVLTFHVSLHGSTPLPAASYSAPAPGSVILPACTTNSSGTACGVDSRSPLRRFTEMCRRVVGRQPAHQS